MAKKIIKAQNESVQNVETDDIHYLRSITRKLLHSVEEAIELYSSKKQAEIEALSKTHNLLFGSKASLADTLVKLADLMIKLNQQQRQEDGRTFEGSAHVMSEIDIALVEDFVKKAKAVD